MQKDEEEKALGELDKGITQDQGFEYFQDDANPNSGGPIDQFARVEKDAKKARNFAERQADANAIEVLSKVTSVYDSRPINGYDGLLTGTVNLLVESLNCPLITAPPNPPFDGSTQINEGTANTGNMQFLGGCNELKTVVTFVDVATGGGGTGNDTSPNPWSVFWFFRSNFNDTFNVYAFDPDGVLIGRKLNEPIDDSDIEVPKIELEFPRKENGDYPLGNYTFVLTGFDGEVPASNRPVDFFVIRQGA